MKLLDNIKLFRKKKLSHNNTSDSKQLSDNKKSAEKKQSSKSKKAPKHIKSSGKKQNLLDRIKLFKNLKLANKIAVLSISVLVFLMAIAFLGIGAISKVNSQIRELNDERLVPILDFEDSKSSVDSIMPRIQDLMSAQDQVSKETAQSDIDSLKKTIDFSLGKYKNNPDYKSLMDDYAAYTKAYNELIDKAGNTGTKQNEPGSQIFSMTTEATNYDRARSNMDTSLNAVIDKQKSAAVETYSTSKNIYKITIIELIALIVFCAAVVLVLSVIITRAIVSPVKKVTDKLNDISNSNGDLTQRIAYNSKDEIGQLSNSFDTFMDKLQDIIKEVAISAETISSSSEQINNSTAVTTSSLDEISKNVTSIAEGVTDSVAVTEETNASLSEATKFSESTSVASKKTAENSKKAKAAAEDGASKITEVVSSINEIASSSKEVAEIMEGLGASSQKIGEIVEIITSISEQTNLLALNAAIEAARAGEAGRGFSVVADEIRKLADESNGAAKQIANLVNENQLKSSSAVESVNEVEEKVSHGVSKASEVSQSINNIIMNIEDIVNQIVQIDNANEQQAMSSKELEKAIGDITSTTNEIAHGTENISASIQEQLSTMSEMEQTTKKLSEMAKNLTVLTSGFKL